MVAPEKGPEPALGFVPARLIQFRRGDTPEADPDTGKIQGVAVDDIYVLPRPMDRDGLR